MLDFTIKQLPDLYKALQSQGFSFISVSDILQNKEISLKYIILRHDVEKYYENALEFARIQNELGIRGVYYFRISGKFFKADIVRQIVSLGHEVGYHYDDLTQCKGNYDLAIKRFEKNLNMLREIAPVKTICMDGSPLSKYDNRNLWRRSDSETERLRDGGREREVGSKEKGGKSKEKEASGMHDHKKEIEHKNLTAHHSSLTSSYHYRDFSIICELYFDLDFNDIFYITDTGRRWDGWKVSVRDKMPQQEKWIRQGLVFHSTNDIIRAAEQGHPEQPVLSLPKESRRMPDKIMMTFHPQRWHDRTFPWLKELVWQNVKNQVKRMLLRLRD